MIMRACPLVYPYANYVTRAWLIFNFNLLRASTNDHYNGHHYASLPLLNCLRGHLALCNIATAALQY